VLKLQLKLNFKKWTKKSQWLFFNKAGDILKLGENEFLLFNPDTGEIGGIFNADTQEIRNKKQTEYYQKNKAQIEKDKMYDFGQSGRFNMFSTFSISQLANENLTGSDYRILLLMMSGVGYKTGYISMGNNHPMTPEWIAKKLDVDKRTVDRCLKKLIDKGIIAINVTEKKKSYFMNPYIQYKGRWISKDLYNMFKDTKWAKQAADEREKEAARRDAMKISKEKRGLI
jgi:predicted transcriptional regulator